MLRLSRGLVEVSYSLFLIAFSNYAYYCAQRATSDLTQSATLNSRLEQWKRQTWGTRIDEMTLHSLLDSMFLCWWTRSGSRSAYIRGRCTDQISTAFLNFQIMRCGTSSVMLLVSEHFKTEIEAIVPRTLCDNEDHVCSRNWREYFQLG